MGLRVIAILLAFVLCWSGLGTIGGPRAFASPPAAPTQAADASDVVAAHESPVAHHLLDDLPPPALGDSQTEPPALLPAPLAPSPALAAMASPRSFASAEAGPPFLAGPLRPPCSAARAG